MKSLVSFLLGVGITCLCISYILKNHIKIPESTNLEIYTLENIYYINGLTVTDEGENPPIRFNTQAELKEYISDITVSDNQKGFDCLENKYQ